MTPERPPRLKKGDVVAALSLSWGGPAAFPAIYENGVRLLELRFGVKVKEYPTTRMDPLELWAHPEARAADLTAALEDPSVDAIVSTIGGDDSNRLLPLLEPGLGRRHPKVFLGFSDTTTLLLHFAQEGLTTFHGPSLMAGFSQMETFPVTFEEHVRNVLFDPTPAVEYRPYSEWSEGYPRWEEEGSVGRTQPPKPHDGWHWVQGKGRIVGEMVGGCLEALEFLKGTRFWPPEEFWMGKVLFFETSEEVPTAVQVKWMVRNYGLQGVFQKASALLFGRARGYSHSQKVEFDQVIQQVVRDEFGADRLPIVTNLDFGHTDPQWVLPLGGAIAVDREERSLTLTRPAVT